MLRLIFFTDPNSTTNLSKDRRFHQDNLTDTESEFEEANIHSISKCCRDSDVRYNINKWFNSSGFGKYRKEG